MALTTGFMQYGAFSLTWQAAMQIYWNKRKCLHKEKSSNPTGLAWYSPT